jgi:HSP20 family protein
MEDFSSRLWGDGGDWMTGDLTTSLDVSESDNEMRVQVDVPGIQPEDIDIQLSGNTLTIRGERKEEEEKKGRTFYRIERLTGRFSRSVTLPYEVDEGNIEAHQQGGVLTITLPKAETAQIKKIEVKS